MDDDGVQEMMEEEPSLDTMEGCVPALPSADPGFGEVQRPFRKIVAIKERYVEPEYPRLPSEGNLEWQYTMRRTMQEIIPGLYLGPYASATRAKLNDMKAAGLTHIVCVRQNLEKNLVRPNHPDHFKYLVVEIADTPTENIIPHFRVVNFFLEECAKMGGKALVHGNAGISRSAALVIGYIMSRFGVTLKEAFSFVQSKRFCCNPNEGFMAQLREYEPIYRAQHTVPLPLPGQERKSKKRELESEDLDLTTNPFNPLAAAHAASIPAASVMDTSTAPFRFGNVQVNNGQPNFPSSSDSSVSSSSESLNPLGLAPHVLNQHTPMVPQSESTDSSMFM